MADEKQLVQACQKGDKQAFSRLIDQYRYPVFGLCLGYTRDFDAAEDATQEAFISAYLNLKSLADPGFFGPWLKRIAINQCKTQWRRLQRLAPIDEAPAEVLTDQAPSPVVLLESNEKRAEVLAAIERVPDAQRQVLTLFYLEEMPLRRIAAFLGISEGSAKQRLYRARLNLKEEMLEMVKETVSNYEFPPDFTQQVVDEALERGQELLDNRDWQGAQDVFRKVVDAIPDHVDANRGLGLALGNEINRQQKNDVFADQKLAQEAFQTLELAFDLGAQDETLIKRLANMYSNFGRHREGGQFLEKVAASRTDWREKIRYLRQAKSIYYHSHYSNGENNKADCVRCHRLIRDFVPDDLDLRVKLDVWVPGGMVLAYAHVGLGDEVLREMDMYENVLGDRHSVWDSYHIAICRMLIHRELEQWEQMAQIGHEFTKWIELLPEGDERLLEPSKTIREDNGFELSMVGEWVRWHMAYLVLNMTAQAEHKLGQDVSKSFAAMDRALEAHEKFFEDLCKQENTKEIEDARIRLGRGYSRAGEGAFLAKEFEHVIRYYKREEELLGKLEMHGPIQLAGALAGLKQTDEAIAQLKKITGRLISTGQWRTSFENNRCFDAIRNNPEVIGIMERWKMAEEAGKT